MTDLKDITQFFLTRDIILIQSTPNYKIFNPDFNEII